MANVREYAYYIKGNKVSIVEKDTSLDNDTGSRDFGPGSNRSQWKSPLATVADGIEIEYTYAPHYFIKETEDKNTVIDTYVSTDGFLKIIDQGDDNYSASPESLSDGSYIVLRNAGKWNGLHKVKAAGTGYITLYTKCSDSSTVQQSFEKTVSLYYNVNALDAETDELDVPRYLANAVVYYVKAKYAEDAGELEMREFFMREFRRLTEKYQTAKQKGARMVQGFNLMR